MDILRAARTVARGVSTADAARDSSGIGPAGSLHHPPDHLRMALRRTAPDGGRFPRARLWAPHSMDAATTASSAIRFSGVMPFCYTHPCLPRIMGEPVRTESAEGRKARCSDDSPALLAVVVFRAETGHRSAKARDWRAWTPNGPLEGCATKSIRGAAAIRPRAARSSPHTRW
jgi:hypothetical protein